LAALHGEVDGDVGRWAGVKGGCEGVCWWHLDFSVT
jgi:hypothetical protein